MDDAHPVVGALGAACGTRQCRGSHKPPARTRSSPSERTAHPRRCFDSRPSWRCVREALALRVTTIRDADRPFCTASRKRPRCVEWWSCRWRDASAADSRGARRSGSARPSKKRPPVALAPGEYSGSRLASGVIGSERRLTQPVDSAPKRRTQEVRFRYPRFCTSAHLQS